MPVNDYKGKRISWAQFASLMRRINALQASVTGPRLLRKAHGGNYNGTTRISSIIGAGAKWITSPYLNLLIRERAAVGNGRVVTFNPYDGQFINYNLDCVLEDVWPSDRTDTQIYMGVLHNLYNDDEPDNRGMPRKTSAGAMRFWKCTSDATDGIGSETYGTEDAPLAYVANSDVAFDAGGDIWWAPGHSYSHNKWIMRFANIWGVGEGDPEQVVMNYREAGFTHTFTCLAPDSSGGVWTIRKDEAGGPPFGTPPIMLITDDPINGDWLAPSTITRESVDYYAVNLASHGDLLAVLYTTLATGFNYPTFGPLICAIYTKEGAAYTMEAVAESAIFTNTLSYGNDFSGPSMCFDDDGSHVWIAGGNVWRVAAADPATVVDCGVSIKAWRNNIVAVPDGVIVLTDENIMLFKDSGQTQWYSYDTKLRIDTEDPHFTIGDTPDGGATVPVGGDFVGSLGAAEYLLDLRCAVRGLAGFFKHQTTEDRLTLATLLSAAMGDRTKYGATGGAKTTWTRRLRPNTNQYSSMVRSQVVLGGLDRQTTHICTQTHVSTNDDKPETGANWAQYWKRITAKPVVGTPFTWVDWPYRAEDWELGTSYTTSSYAYGASGTRPYSCTQAHTASAENEPGVGASWEDYWEQIAANGSVIPQWRAGQNYYAAQNADVRFGTGGDIQCSRDGTYPSTTTMTPHLVSGSQSENFLSSVVSNPNSLDYQSDTMYDIDIGEIAECVTYLEGCDPYA